MPEIPTSPSGSRTRPARAGAESDQELVVEHEDTARGGTPGSTTDVPGAESGVREPGVREPGGPRTRTVRPSTTGSTGLLLAGRYRLEERRDRDGDSSLWDAHDTQLERAVIVRVVSGRAVPASLEGARLAASHPAPGLTRVLDTGSARATDGTMLAWIVEEHPAGERLDDLVRAAPLDTARARSVVGQVSLVLADAARGGLHHRRLTPSSVYVSGRQVVVSGLVVAAAAAGAPPADAASALAEDGRALVALLYTALTGRWPGDEDLDASGTPQPLAPLRDLAPDVPDGLDALVTSVLTGSGRDRVTPHALEEILLGGGDRDAGGAATGDAPEDAGSTRPAHVVLPDTAQLPAQGGPAPQSTSLGLDDPSGDPEPADAQPADAQPVGTGSADARPLDGAAVGGAAVAAGTGDAAVAASTGADADHGSARGARRAAREARASREPSGVEPDRSAPDGPDDPAVDGPSDDATTGAAPLGGARRGRRAALTGAAGAAGAAAGTALTRSRDVVRAAVARPPTHRGSAATSRRASNADAPAGGDAENRPTDRSVGSGSTGSLPLVETIPGGRRGGGPSHLRGPVVIGALAVVAVAVLLAAVLAFRQVPSLQSIREAVLGDDATIASTIPSSPDEGSGDGTGPNTSPVVVASVSALDPQGDGSENGEAAGNVIDGDPATSWMSETYASAALGNLKDGVGLDLELESEATVSEVEITVEGTGGEVEVRTSPDGSFGDSSTVATSSLDGATTIAVDPAVTTSHVVLWFTELPSTDDGFRIDASDVTLR